MEKKYFFITGPPRFRGAWLANLFTYKNSFCFNTATKQCTSVDELKQLLSSVKEKYVGDSDNSILWFFEELHDFLKDAKILLIDVDKGYSTDYLINKVIPINPLLNKQWLYKLMDALYMRMAEFKYLYNPVTIPVDYLKSKELCNSLWNHILPTIPFSKNRWKLLSEMTVEANNEEFNQDVDNGKGLFILDYIQWNIRKYT